jgi:hypothetical protein
MARKSKEQKAKEERQANLERLYDATINELLSRIEQGSAVASELSAAIKLLKDAGILASREETGGVDFDLPFDDDD